MITSGTLAVNIFNPSWRRAKSEAFDLWVNSTAQSVTEFSLWGHPVRVYANANFSIYSGQRCNASCRFCVEELRPISRGISLATQQRRAVDDSIYFTKLEECLFALSPLSPSISITGGEPSKDPRLPKILHIVRRFWAPRKTLTTNGSGLLDKIGPRTVLEHITEAKLGHLNLSVAHYSTIRNAQIMRLRQALSEENLRIVAQEAAQARVRVRLSCVLLSEGISSLAAIIKYLDFAASLGVDNVIFRQLMKSDPTTQAANSVVEYSDAQRIQVEPLLDQISNTPEFEFVRQIMGYYYYVEVWRYAGMDVVFEEADLARIELVKHRDPGIIHELVFHPGAVLSSTWQPWDGVLGPCAASPSEKNTF